MQRRTRDVVGGSRLCIRDLVLGLIGERFWTGREDSETHTII
jgi:hypothetical protein